mgnify:CR=1 FL=1
MTTADTTLPLIDPARFRTALEKTLDGLFELAELTATPAEREYACWFSLSGDRPWYTEWLQSLQDLLQVMHEPRVLGTLLLNSNPSFMLDAVPERPFPFRLGYFSVTSEPGETAVAFWERAVKPLLEARFPLWQQQSMLLAVCCSPACLNMDAFDFADLMDVGLKVDEAVDIIAAEVAGEAQASRTLRMFGTACDALLGERTRLSGWVLG